MTETAIALIAGIFAIVEYNNNKNKLYGKGKRR